MIENSLHNHLENLLDDAEACLNAGDVDRAITVLGEAYKIDPRHLRVSCLLVFCALRKGKLDDAHKYFSFVVRIDPNNASALLGLKRVADHTAAPPPRPHEAQVKRPFSPPAPVTSQKKSETKVIVQQIILGILWLPLLGLGGYLGGLIGYKIGEGAGALLGGFLGIVSVQAIYVAIYPRRR